MPRLSARFFGYPEVELDGTPVKIERHKTLALLAYLGVTGKRLGRDALAALFWPDLEESQANAYLRHTLWELRKALGEVRIEIDREAVGLAPEADLWIDVARFQDLLAQGEADRAAAEGILAEAVSLYRDDFLAGFTLRDSPDFDEWQLLQAESLRRQYGEALRALVDACTARGEYDTAIAHAQRWLALDALDESPHRALMQLYAWVGRRSAAIRQYETCANILRDQLGAAPEAATTVLYDQIRAGAIGARVGRATVPTPGRAPVSAAEATLPSEATPFVGREDELAQIAHLLAEPECRLLTLVGPGGIGKTRLALQAARSLQAGYRQGTVIVPLAGLGAGDELVAALAERLKLTLEGRGGMGLSPAQEKAQLLDYLHGRALLLVLDNMEHLTGVAGLLSEMVAAAPELKLLVTSRERLNLPEEWVFDVPSLPYPGPDRAGNPEDYAAVQLFLKSAQRARAGLALQDADWPAIVRICQLMEGMPLGIELAAAWVKMLSCPEIAAELERGQDFLASTQRGIPERHRSLRTVFDHSWGLLTEAERNTFSRLAIFQGGFTREAAAQVTGATLATLAALIGKSLVRRNADGRYDLHQVLRQYAAEKLAQVPQAQQETQSRHGEYYLDLLEEAGEQLMGSEQNAALARLTAEAGNLRLAWQQAIADGALERIHRVLPAWTLYHEMAGRRREGLNALQPAVAAARAAGAGESADPTARGLLAFLLAAQKHFGLGAVALEQVRAALQESLALARTLPDGLDKAFALLLDCSGLATEAEEAQALLAQCLAIFRALDHRWGMAVAQLIWADSLNMGSRDCRHARAMYQASRTMFAALENRWGEALCLWGLASVATQEGRCAEAIALAQECLAIYQALGDSWRISGALDSLAEAMEAGGDLAGARRHYERSLAYLRQMGQRVAIAFAVHRLGDLTQRLGDLPAARAHFRECLALCREMGEVERAAAVAERLRAIGEGSEGTGEQAGGRV